MKRRAFLLNTTVLLLIIPLLLLLATYEDASSYILSAQGERVQAERTFDVVKYISMDLQKALELSGKRAIVAEVDYVVITGNFISGANTTMKDLLLGDHNNPLYASPDVRRIMKNQTLSGWWGNISTLLRKQGYVLRPDVSEIISHADITVAPLDSFHIVIKARLTNITVRDLSGKVIYTGPIPRKGYVYSIITITDLEDPYYAVTTGGRYHRSIQACGYAFPQFTGPFTVANGSGNGTTSAGVFGENFKYNALRIWSTNGSVSITNLTVGGSRVSPQDVILKEGDRGVIVANLTSSGPSWCDGRFEKKVRMTLPPGTPSNSLVLLVFDTASVASSFGSAAHSGSEASLRIYDSSCNPVGYWIEHWDNDRILLWIKTSLTRDYYIYYSGDPSFESRGTIWIFPYYKQNVAVSGGSKKEVPVFTDIPFGSFFLRYALKAESNTTDFDGGISISWPSESAGYLMVNVSYPRAVTDVQIPIYLNSSVARIVNHDSSNRAEIEVYSDSGFTQPVPFWIEYWNDKGALIWVRGNLPGTYYIKYNTGTMTRGNGNEVFLFFDDFRGASLNTSKWNVRMNRGRGRYSVRDGILYLYGDNNRYTLDVWMWSKKTFPYSSYVVGMKVLMKNRPLWMWYITGGSGYGEHVIGQWGRLDEVSLASGMYNYLEWGGSYLKNTWTHVEIAVEDWYDWRGDHYADFITYQNTTGPFTGTWSGNTREVSYYSDYPAESDTAIGLGQFYKGPSEYDFVYVRKYLDLNKLSTEVFEKKGSSVSSFQFLDDNPGHPDITENGNDWLVILSNWSRVVGSGTSTTGYKGVESRYEVRFISGSELTKLGFTYNPNATFSPIESSTRLGGQSSRMFNVSVALDNEGNDAYFSWIVLAPYPYVSYSGGSVVFSPPENRPSTRTANARVYDIQPLVDCLKKWRYFGVYGGLSFFDRLEGNPRPKQGYIDLSRKLQDELGYKYKGEYYPIGLVSFLIPSGEYDPKLANLFSTLGLTPDNTSSADYYFLPHYFSNAVEPKGYPVWGISWGGIPSEDLRAIKFYLDPETARQIFGNAYYRDLLYGYSG